MKKNLILFGLFIFLMILTYIFQEKRIENDYVEAQVKDRLFTAEVTQLKTPELEAVKKGDQWWYKNILLSHNSFKQIEKKLSEIKKIKSIAGEYKNFFTSPYTFEVNGIKCAIGDLSLDKQSFYISIGDKISLAVIDGSSTELTQDEGQIAAMKLEELVNQLSKPITELKERQLFRFYPNLPSEKAVVESDGNLPYELDFKNNTTSPGSIPGVSVHEKLKGKFLSLLTQMNIKEEVSYDQKLKFKKLATLSLLEDQRKVSWDVWVKDAKSADAYIIDEAGKKSYLMVGGTLKIFFINLQDYWDKKTIPPKSFTQFTRLTTRFTQGPKTAEVIILNKEPLAFETQNFKVDQGNMEGLIQLIFNLGQRDQAERVSIFSKTDRQQVLSQERLKIEVFGQELIVWRKKEEIIVVNATQGFKTHYNLLDENFSGTFGDVLK